MAPVQHPLMPSRVFGMSGDLGAGMEHLDLTMADPHGDAGSPQPPGDAVAVSVDLDRAVVVNDATQLADLPERRPAIQSLQSLGLIAAEPLGRRLAGGAMDAQVRHLAHPPVQVRLHGLPAGEAMAGDGVALDVANPALILAFCPGSEGRARPRPEAPVPGEGMEAGIELDLARLPVIFPSPFPYCTL